MSTFSMRKSPAPAGFLPGQKRALFVGIKEMGHAGEKAMIQYVFLFTVS